MLNMNLVSCTFVYVAYAVAVWTGIWHIGHGSLSEPKIAYALTSGAVVCVGGAVSSFAVLALCRRFRLLGLPEYLGALIGRTGVPCCFVLVCLAVLDEQTMRATTYRVLTAYLLTAPIHVWLTIPSESEFQKRYVAIDENKNNR